MRNEKKRRFFLQNISISDLFLKTKEKGLQQSRERNGDGERKPRTGVSRWCIINGFIGKEKASTGVCVCLDVCVLD